MAKSQKPFKTYVSNSKNKCGLGCVSAVTVCSAPAPLVFNNDLSYSTVSPVFSCVFWDGICGGGPAR